jgi:hypothetical protein
MNYLDDRKEKKLRDEMERQRRQALLEQAERRAQAEAASPSSDPKTQLHQEPVVNDGGLLEEQSDEEGSDSESDSESKR